MLKEFSTQARVAFHLPVAKVIFGNWRDKSVLLARVFNTRFSKAPVEWGNFKKNSSFWKYLDLKLLDTNLRSWLMVYEDSTCSKRKIFRLLLHALVPCKAQRVYILKMEEWTALLLKESKQLPNCNFCFVWPNIIFISSCFRWVNILGSCGLCLHFAHREWRDTT